MGRPLDIIRTLGIVSVVTVLIWILLEAESLRRAEVQVAISLAAPQGLVVREAGERVLGVRATVTLDGPTAALARVEKILDGGLTLTVGAELSADPGEHVIELDSALSRHRALASSGVTIAAVRPQRVVVRVDEMVTLRGVPVRVDAPSAELSGAAEARPATVDLTVPKSLAEKLKAGATVTAVIGADLQARLVRGRRETIRGVTLTLPPELSGALAWTLEPATVDVDLTLLDRTTQITIPSVPVHVRLPAPEANAWAIEIPTEDRILRGVVITGPGELIEQIKAGKLPIIAWVAPTFEELERSATRGELLIKDAVLSDLPPAFNPIRVEAANRKVRLSVQRREPASPGLLPDDPGQ